MKSHKAALRTDHINPNRINELTFGYGRALECGMKPLPKTLKETHEIWDCVLCGKRTFHRVKITQGHVSIHMACLIKITQVRTLPRGHQCKN